MFTKQETLKWLYDTYQVDDDVDLGELWSDIHHNGLYGQARSLISYNLRNEFGGYCSEANLRLLLEGKVSKLNNHWKDGGCDKAEPDLEEYLEEEQEQESSSSGSSTEQPTSGPNTYNVSYPASFLERFRSGPEACWISIDGSVYDVTPGGYEYPGPGSITSLCGQNASEHFSSNNLSNPPQEYYRGRIRQ